MEALISVTVAALAVIDMAKGVDRSALAPRTGPRPPLCAVPCFLSPSLVCDTRGTGARADPRKRDGWIPAGSRGEQRTIARIPLQAAVRAAP